MRIFIVVSGLLWLFAAMIVQIIERVIPILTAQMAGAQLGNDNAALFTYQALTHFPYSSAVVALAVIVQIVLVLIFNKKLQPTTK